MSFVEGLLGLLEALAAPFTSERLLVEVIWQIGIFLLIAVSLDLVMGFSGMFQLGHIGFFALGAIGTTFGTKPEHLGLDLFGGILFGWLLATAAVLLIGIPTLRLRGDYFAIATFGFTLSTQAVMLGLWATGVFDVPTLNPLGCDTACLADTAVGGVIGTAIVTAIGAGDIAQPAKTGVGLAILGVFVVAVYVLLGRMKHSPFGRLLKSIREDHRAALSLGKDVQTTRLKALWISALVQALAGSLWVHHVGNLGPNFYGFQFLILTVIAVIIGGLGSHVGALLGAILFVVVNEESKSITSWAGSQFPGVDVDYASLRFILFGALLVLVMVMRPQGILGEREVTLRGLWRALRRRLAGGGAGGGSGGAGGRPDEGGGSPGSAGDNPDEDDRDGGVNHDGADEGPARADATQPASPEVGRG